MMHENAIPAELKHAVPKEAFELAEELTEATESLEHRGLESISAKILGTAWGIRENQKELGTTIFVTRRTSSLEQLYGGRAEIAEVGSIVATPGIDHRDETRGRTITRPTTISLLAAGNPDVAIVSGHGALPVISGRIMHRLASNTAISETKRSISFFDQQTHQNHGGRLKFGDCGGGSAFDMALVEMSSGTVDLTRTEHPALVQHAPVRRALRSLQLNARVLHSSRMRGGQKIRGTYQGVTTSPLEIELPDGSTTTFTELLVVRSQDEFALPGDSGSLVALEATSEAVGVIVGRSDDGLRAFVAALDKWVRRSSFNEYRGRFFKE